MTTNEATPALGGGGKWSRKPYTTHGGPLFFAHRGGALLRPENTMLAFEHGVSLGADALELDLQLTRDGELVVIHDFQVDRTTDGTGPIANYTLDELRRLDAGYRFTPDGGKTFPYRGQGVTIPTLRSIFERFPSLRINMDLKESTPEREERLWRLLQEMDAVERVLIGSFDYAPMMRFRTLTGGRVATGATRREIFWFLVRRFTHRLGGLRPAFDALQVPETDHGFRIVTPRMIAAAHRLDLDVHVWTIDAPSDMRRLLMWGADGIMSDRPDLLAQVLAERATD
ncbi:MAG TPA: glycerophosphodiester phosphodiesterase [Ktedonobacterales bacterium]